MRNADVDFLRFIAMIAVLFIHCSFPGQIGVYLRALNAFAVPIFFMTSGYFCQHSNQEKLLKRIKRLLLIVICANAFYLVWDIFYELIRGENLIQFIKYVFNIKNVIIFILFNESPLRGHLWFLGALLYCYLVLFTLLKMDRIQISNFLYTLIIGYCVQIILAILQYEEKIPILIRNWAFTGMPFFFMGYNYNDHRKKIATKK